jgi:hypothetical protein
MKLIKTNMQKKAYTCTQCDRAEQHETNHWGNIFPFCKTCRKTTRFEVAEDIPEEFIPLPKAEQLELMGGTRFAKISMESVISKTQKSTQLRESLLSKQRLNLTFNDHCGNGHNSFHMTIDLYEKDRGSWVDVGGGSDHESVRKYFTKYARLAKWHGCTTEGPLYYFQNTKYHLTNGDLKAAQGTAIWPGATIDELSCETQMKARLADLLELFRAEMETIGFTW